MPKKVAPIYQVIADSVVMNATPDPAAEAVSEALFGEQIEILEEVDEWVKGVCLTDGYEGYVFRGALDNEPSEATHRVQALRTYALCEPDFKSPPLRVLSFFSPLSVVLEDNGFSLLEQGGWVYTEHICEIANLQSDPVEVALKFLETPYLWGGRSSIGIDCSALVQLALMSAGHACPRDTKDQARKVGKDVDPEALKRGDLVYFKGHVGIMLDDSHILNATARHMKVCIENLKDVTNAYDGIVSVRRVG